MDAIFLIDSIVIMVSSDRVLLKSELTVIYESDNISAKKLHKGNYTFTSKGNEESFGYRSLEEEYQVDRK